MANKLTGFGGTDLIDGIKGEAVDWVDTLNEVLTIAGRPLMAGLDFIMDGVTATSQFQYESDSDNSNDDTSNSTSYKFGNRHFCASTGNVEETLIDDFGDASFSTDWDSAVSGITGSSTATVVESGGKLKATVSKAAGDNTTVTASYQLKITRTNGWGKTLVAEFDFSASDASGGSATVLIFWSDGSNEVLLKSYADTSGSNYKIKVVPSVADPTTHVKFHIDTGGGYDAGTEVDVSSVTGIHATLKFKASGSGGGGGPTASANIDALNFWGDNYEASNMVIANRSSLTASKRFLIVPKDINSGAGTTLDETIRVASIQYSVDNGSAYTSNIARGRIQGYTSTSTQIKGLFVMNFDNSTALQMKTTVIEGWSMYYF